MIYTYNEILLFILKKEGHSTICYMNETLGHYAKWNDNDRKNKYLIMTWGYLKQSNALKQSTMVTAKGGGRGMGSY